MSTTPTDGPNGPLLAAPVKIRAVINIRKKCKSDGPTFMPLLPIPDVDDCNRDSSLILTGAARRGPFGPSVGVVDIGISKVAYLFRISLPGVKKDCSMFLLFLFAQVSYSSLFIVFDYQLEGFLFNLSEMEMAPLCIIL